MQAGYCRHVWERDAVNDSHSGCLPTTLSKHVILQTHKLNIIIDQWVTEMYDSQTPAWNITDLMGRTLKISNKLFIMFTFDSAAPAVHTNFMCISIHPCMSWVFVSGICCSSFTRLQGQSDKDLPFSSRSGSSAYCLCSVCFLIGSVWSEWSTLSETFSGEIRTLIWINEYVWMLILNVCRHTIIDATDLVKIS